MDNDVLRRLLAFMDQGSVIPIVGQDLLELNVAGEPRNAMDLLAEHFARDCGLDPLTSDGQRLTLFQAVARSPDYPDMELLSIGLNKVFKQHILPLGIPEPLRLLADIEAFRLFLSTSIDSWLEQALNAKYGLNRKAVSVPIRLRTSGFPEDIQEEHLSFRQPVVCQLFGKIGNEPYYALTEEICLESVCQMLQHPPKRLSEKLLTNRLLFLGNSPPDWLARFFIRMIRGERLGGDDGHRKKDVFVIVDNGLRQSHSLRDFLGQCPGARPVHDSSPVEFVRLLHERWVAEGHKEQWIKNHGNQDPWDDGAPRLAPSLFISYAVEDKPAVAVIASALKSAAMDVWMDDQGGLVPGDEYAPKIKQQIDTCHLFIAVISRANLERKEGFYRQEWAWALERRNRMKQGQPFIIPVVVDDTDPRRRSDFPPEFHAICALMARNGKLSGEQVQTIVDRAEGLLLQGGSRI